jgi:hypothetical protein
MKSVILILRTLILSAFVTALHAQQAVPPNLTEAQRDAEIKQLHTELDALAARLAALESSPNQIVRPGVGGNPSSAATAVALPDESAATSNQPLSSETSKMDEATLTFFRGTTLSFVVDGYYGYNFNAPIGRVNLLRAYDVTSNSFSINQAGVIIEHLPNPEQRFGGRLDLQFGQATETLQGSSVNEQRPQVWRNLFQAYGSYLAPVGSGLQIDFGKFASSLGNEGNYTKDQITYSRSYSFNYLPFYHMGLRANYNVTPRLNVAYWLVNGANDTEDLNGFKSQAFLFTIKPASTLSWNVNYYFGQEARDVVPTLNPAAPSSPTQPGLPTTNVNPAPNGREHIFDTYAAWSATPKLTLVGEADYVLNRTLQQQQPPRVIIGSLTAKYALAHHWNLGARAEYFDDRGGLFSGKTQALKEGTISLDHQFAPGFLARAEFRRDFSNQPFFLTDTQGALVHAQSTATLGLVYWWGLKQGSW